MTPRRRSPAVIAAPSASRPGARKAFRIFGIAACVLVAVAALLILDLGPRVDAAISRVESLGWAGPPLFVLLHALAVVVLLPGVLFPLAAGFLFGWPLGSALSAAGKLLGAVVAFRVARAAKGRVAPERARRALARYPLLQRLDHGLSDQGWRLVALIRMIPVIPFKLSNYLFGWTRFGFRDYLAGTALGVIPYSVVNAYLGSLAAGLGAPPAETGPDQPAWLWGAIGLMATVSALLVTRRALHILRQATGGDGEGNG